MSKSLLCWIFSLCCLCSLCLGDKVKEKIYIKLSTAGISACFRRFDNNGQVGCSSERGGNVGVVHYIESDPDLDWVMSKGPHSPYVVLLDNQRFNNETMIRLTSVSGRVNGVLILGRNTTIPDRFSPDSSCPNNKYGRYRDDEEYRDCNKVRWNKESGESLMWRDWGIPIVNLRSSADGHGLIHDCYVKFNKPTIHGVARSYPLCSAEVKTVMDGGKDTPTCTRRSNTIMNLNPVNYCDPLADRNVFLMSKVYNSTEIEEKSVIVAATRLDSFSMFQDMAPGVNSAITGVVTLLAVIETLSQVKDELNDDMAKPILFTFFHGEAFDYIGSSRMVYDMEQNLFPTEHIIRYNSSERINLTHIGSFLEVQQVGLKDQGKLWMHSDPVSQANPNVTAQVEEMKRLLLESEADISLDSPPKGQPLPPASFQSFLKKIEVPGLVITDHRAGYSNQYYNSRYDLPFQINATYPDDLPPNEVYDYVTPAANQIQAVATTVSRTLFKMATGQNLTIQTDNMTVTHLLFCFLYNINCTLLQSAASPSSALKISNMRFFNTYIGTDRYIQFYPKAVNALVAYFYGDNMTEIANVTKSEECKRPSKNYLYNYNWVSGPLVWNSKEEKSTSPYAFCLRSQVNYSQALSPAFIKNDYDWGSGEYSSWSQSAWQQNGAFSVRYFLVPSQTRQIVTLCIGIAVFIIGLLLVFAVNRGAPVIFEPPTSS